MSDYPLIAFTVLLSVFLHGLSTMPLARLYGTHAMDVKGLSSRIQT